MFLGPLERRYMQGTRRTIALIVLLVPNSMMFANYEGLR